MTDYSNHNARDDPEIVSSNPVAIDIDENLDNLDFFSGLERGSVSIERMTGWLMKKGSGTSKMGRRNWKNRFFVLESSKIRYYAKESDVLANKAKARIIK